MVFVFKNTDGNFGLGHAGMVWLAYLVAAKNFPFKYFNLARKKTLRKIFASVKVKEINMAEKTPQTMEELVSKVGLDKLIPFREGDIVEVTITDIGRARISVNIVGLLTGIVPEREFSADVSQLKVGDKALAYIILLENEDGQAILSLKRADKERLWRALENRQQDGEVLSVKIKNANRGGLLVEYGGLEGFLPVSQLSSAHYPRVGGETYQIISHLQKLIGQVLKVKVLSFDRQAGKLIFSEKAAGDDAQEAAIAELKIGQKITGKITGIVDFGLFVNLGQIEGLVHISEIAWEKVENLAAKYKVGQEVEVMVIGIEAGRVSLSIKRLRSDPWVDEASKFQVGQTVEGEVVRVLPFGALVRLAEQVEGLAHISQLGRRASSVQEIFAIGQKTKFEILQIEPQSRRISLKPVLEDAQKEKKAAPKTKTLKKKTAVKTASKRRVKNAH